MITLQWVCGVIQCMSTALCISCVTPSSMLPVFILHDSLHSNSLVIPPPCLTDSKWKSSIKICDAIKQNESEISQIQFLFFWLIRHIICKATFNNLQTPCIEILPFYNSVRRQRLTQERQKFVLHHGKMSTNKCRAIRNYTWACFKWPKNVDKTILHWNTQYNNNLHS